MVVGGGVGGVKAQSFSHFKVSLSLNPKHNFFSTCKSTTKNQKHHSDDLREMNARMNNDYVMCKMFRGCSKQSTTPEVSSGTLRDVESFMSRALL